MLRATATPRPNPADVPPCCWTTLLQKLDCSAMTVRRIHAGGRSANLAVDITTRERGPIFVKGARLQGASTRDRDRFDIERSVLERTASVAGTPTLLGYSTCHWMLMATTWVNGMPMTEHHPASLLQTFASILAEASACVPAPWPTLPTIADVLHAKRTVIEHGLTWFTTEMAHAARQYLDTASSAPTSLRHGGLWPDNLLCSPTRPSVVDWASSIWGPTCWDTATLALLAGQLGTPRSAISDVPVGAIVVRAILTAHTITDHAENTPALARDLLAGVAT
ncbi:phosphotransferase [Mycolicibacterium sp. jd]|uniref:phosphotransferase n=1 Tax=unclassified Mycolicibacterium TaxID=2636767 RepID=UPI00351BC0AB